MPLYTVDAATLADWMKQNRAVLVDVREPAEHAGTRIAGAHLLPLGQVRLARMPEHADRKLVIHCLKGGRGTSACETLLKEDPTLEVYNLAGGIEAWSAAGLPLMGKGGHLPLDRQVQMTIGLLLLTSAALSWWINPAFVGIAAFFGAGLTFAGATGFCGLARVLAAMPWNQHKAA